MKRPNPDEDVNGKRVEKGTSQKIAATKASILQELSSAIATPTSESFTDSALANGYTHLYLKRQRGKDATPSIAIGPKGRSDHLRDNSSKSLNYTDSSLADGYPHLYHEGQRGKDATPSIATCPNVRSDHLRDNSSKENMVKGPNPDKVVNRKRVEEGTSQKTVATSRRQKMSSAGATKEAVALVIPQKLASRVDPSLSDACTHLSKTWLNQGGTRSTPPMATTDHTSPTINGQSQPLRNKVEQVTLIPH